MVMKKKSAYWKDVWRSVAKGKKRFISIALIATLGVTMMCGLRAACVDLRYSADQFFDEQNLFDIRILSTLGLTDEDLAALETLDSVKAADGGFNESVYTRIDGMRRSIEVRTLSENEFNRPYLIEGRLPERNDEIVITENFKNQSGKTLGDRITLDEESEYLKSEEYIITGIIIDALDINSSEGAMGFRSTSSTDYVGYVASDAADYDVYTVVYLALEGTEELNCYTDEYEEKVEQVVEDIESKIKTQREKARYEEVHGEAMEAWLDGEQEMKEEFARADAEIADAEQELADGKEKLEEARKEIEDGKQQLADGQAELDSQSQLAESQIASARNEIASGKAEIASGKRELEQARRELIRGQEGLDAGKAELEAQETAAEEQFAAAHQQLEESEAQLNAGQTEYEEGKQQFDILKSIVQPQIDAINRILANVWLPEEQKAQYQAKLDDYQAQLDAVESELVAAEQQLTSGRQQLETGKAELEAQEAAAKEQFAEARQQLEAGQAEIDAGWEQYYAGLAALESGEQQLEAGEAELDSKESSAKAQIAAGQQELEAGRKELADGEKELADGEKELADGEAALAESLEEYEEEKAKAEKELADAKAEIDDIDMTRWYVQDRSSLSGYSNVKSDADSIQEIGDVFPILFLTVAILISLTTITRMVEEERGLIGTYKALGFTNGEIRRKYLIYAATACLIGGLIGDIGGYVILPAIIFIIFKVMYILPEYAFRFDLLYGLGGILLFEVGIVGATAYTCRRSLKKMPAKLMRPKSPKAGSRVLLEHIPFIWKNLSFLNKVTARNLFRYKKRLLMTVFGITGCTALLLCGFTIKNTVSEMMPQQYQQIYQYDLMAVSSGDDFDKLEKTLEEDEEVEDYISVRIESVDVINEEEESETVQMLVVPEGSSLEDYICLKNKKNQIYELQDGDIFLTRNAAKILELEEGDTVLWQNLNLTEAKAPITHIAENYLGNMVYMTEKTYTELFGTFEVNGTLANFSDECEDAAAYADDLTRQDGILSAMSTQSMEDEFEPAFALINMVVYVVLVLAAMLAFVVLFTLSNTNISERERELATIKVLGFYNHEVHSYVNKETLILTSIGILFGMPAGFALGRYLMGILEFPSLEFYIILYPESYLIAGAITFAFALIVDFITNRTLDKIDMVEALKSVE